MAMPKNRPIFRAGRSLMISKTRCFTCLWYDDDVMIITTSVQRKREFLSENRVRVR